MLIRSLIIFFSLCQFAFSHELKPAIANLELTSKPSEIHYELKIQLNLESIISEVDPNHDNTNESKNNNKNTNGKNNFFLVELFSKILIKFCDLKANFFCMLCTNAQVSIPS